MAIALRQAAYASGGEGDRTARATFSTPTSAGSMLLAAVAITHPGSTSSALSGPSGWSTVGKVKRDELTVALYYRANAPATSTVSVSNSSERSIQLRVFEYTGIAQSSPLDKSTSREGTSKTISSGSTGTTSQADELVFAVVGNRYTTSQSGFSGGFAQLYNSTSPSDDEESDRTRLSIHSRVTTSTGSFSIGGSLSSSRDWVAIVAAFKGGSSGPALFSSTGTEPMVSTDTATGELSAFGPLRATATDDTAAMVSADGATAWIGPFAYQYRLGGTSGLLIGTGTPYRVEALDGLEGWEMRTSDADLPRGDGAQRGVDLQSPRQVMFTVNIDGTRAEIEAYLADLYTALRPQREDDWQLYWRHPGRDLRYVWCRPTQLIREMDIRQVLLARQSFTLRMADPRHYGAVLKVASVPVLPAGATTAFVVNCANAGNARAYPVIRVRNDDATDLTALSVINASADVRFEYTGTVPSGSELIADMGARIRATGDSVITLDGQSKYSGWDFPRDAFYLAPDPDVNEGSNSLYIATEPAGADVACSVEWRDTYSG